MVGDPTEVAAISKHERFKWVHWKHYYHGAQNSHAIVAGEE